MTKGNPYDDLIMDHIKNARNYRVLEDTNRTATGFLVDLFDDAQIRFLRRKHAVIGIGCVLEQPIYNHDD